MRKIEPAKATIFICVLLSAVGFGTHYWLESRTVDSEAAVNNGLRALGTIFATSDDIRTLKDMIDKDEYLKTTARTGGLRTFFDNVGKDKGMGASKGLSVPGRKETSLSSKQKQLEFKDSYIELTWGKNVKFTREQIAQFMWEVERKSALLKVTELSMEQDSGRNPDDMWELSLTVSERRAASPASGN